MFTVGMTWIAAATSAASLSLLSDQDYAKAKCMDGTQAGYYFEKATKDSNDWVFLLEGGGECTTESACKHKLSGSLGSSKYFKQTKSLTGLVSADSSNPLNEWNRIYVPYCSQDLHSGQRSTPSADSWGLIFSGHNILEAIIDKLMDAGLNDSSTVVLTGDSAGGIGVWPNIDWLQTKLSSARVVGVPLAGFYFYAYPYTGPGHTSSTLADFRPPAWPQHVKLWDSFLPQSCVAAGGGPGCMLSNISGRTVKAPMFVIEAETDSVQLTAHDWVPRKGVQKKKMSPEIKDYLAEWRDNQTVGIAANLKPGDGYFRPACFIHTTFSADKPKVSGESYTTAFYKWLKGTPVRLMDDCGLLCNPSCPAF